VLDAGRFYRPVFPAVQSMTAPAEHYNGVGATVAFPVRFWISDPASWLAR
jgi:hypothetical protein